VLSSLTYGLRSYLDELLLRTLTSSPTYHYQQDERALPVNLHNRKSAPPLRVASHCLISPPLSLLSLLLRRVKGNIEGCSGVNFCQISTFHESEVATVVTSLLEERH